MSSNECALFQHWQLSTPRTQRAPSTYRIIGSNYTLYGIIRIRLGNYTLYGIIRIRLGNNTLYGITRIQLGNYILWTRFFCWYIDTTSGKLAIINQLFEIGLIQKLHLVPR